MNNLMTANVAKSIITRYFLWCERKKIGQNPAKNPKDILNKVLTKCDTFDFSRLHPQIIENAILANEKDKTMMLIEPFARTVFYK